MRIYPLSRWVVFGKLDSSDPVDFDFEVNDAEFELLKKHENADAILSMEPELETLYQRALEESSELSQKELQAMLEPDEDDDTDYYDYHVGFRT